MMNSARPSFRSRALGAGLRALGASGLPRLATPFARGAGAILMFHHVRPWVERGFAPNRGLEITPEFLDETLVALRDNGFDVIAMDDVPARLKAGRGKPFAALTFDDAYRDNLVHALPVLEKHGAPFTINVTTDFAKGVGRLWWTELEEAIRALPTVTFERVAMPAGTDAEKVAAFMKIYWSLRGGSEERLLSEIATLARVANINRATLTQTSCMNWDEIARLSKHPLCTMGAHTLTHPRLAKLTPEQARREIEDCRAIIVARTGKPVKHLAYPVGDPTSAGAREFAIAEDLGFATAVTTRKGMIFPEHRDHLLALPRLSINGEYQSRRYLDLLLTGAPFLLWNRGRRIAA
jgi:peptidoglycan/xylan/chitin deacetylase (PgdA/CDA1 family)